jgi:hypothetical protein
MNPTKPTELRRIPNRGRTTEERLTKCWTRVFSLASYFVWMGSRFSFQRSIAGAKKPYCHASAASRMYRHLI